MKYDVIWISLAVVAAGLVSSAALLISPTPQMRCENMGGYFYTIKKCVPFHFRLRGNS